MSILINFKICDNVKECGGIAECPTGSIFWDEDAGKIGVDSSKCNCCKVCETACGVGAIHVAKNQDEYQKIKFGIDSDTRRKEDLFVDRYGATPIDDSFLINSNQLESEILSHKNLFLAECFNEDSIQCLLKSIPISEIVSRVGGCAAYRKIEADDSICSKFGIKELPALLVFSEGMLIGMVNGFYETSQQDYMTSELLKVINNTGY